MRRSEIGDNCIDDMFYLRDSLIWKIEHEKLKLETRINKAIEYIENNWIEYSDFQYVDNDDELNIDCESIKELIDILKGSDSNGHNKE